MFSPVDKERLAGAIRRNRVRDGVLEARPRRAAAFLLLFEREETRALFLRKKVTPGYPWSGQIGMAGGFIEKEDDDDLAAAYREVEEELQIGPDEVELIGELGFFPTQLSNVSLHVFVGLWDGERQPRPDPGEIDRLVDVPVADLVKTHEREGYAGKRVDEIAVRELNYPTEAGEIWGVTGRVVFAFNEMIRPGPPPP